MYRLLLATRNSHKTREIAEILGSEFELRDLAGMSELPAVEETGETFEANAVLKAVDASSHFPGWVVADDSGLEVDALQGEPGVYSARYAGVQATDTANVIKLLGDLRRCGPGPFSARFRCVLALAEGGTLRQTFQGAVEGTIVSGPRGSAGFGYDPIFQPKGFEQTFAELSAGEKNQMSHRAQAIRLLRAALLAKP